MLDAWDILDTLDGVGLHSTYTISSASKWMGASLVALTDERFRASEGTIGPG